MIKAYKLRLYPNKSKARKLDKLLTLWRGEVNRKISLFWKFDKVAGSFCPARCSFGGRVIRDASIKAWQIVKGARKKEQEMPVFKGQEIDLNQHSGYTIPDFKTKEFDLWMNIISLEKHKRLKVPCKKTRIFNEALEKGQLKKSFKLQKVNGGYFMAFFVEFPDRSKKNDKILGLDVGLDTAIATSDGELLGQEIKGLRTRTKHRTYKGSISPTKQSLNHYAKKLVEGHPETDFVVEDLLFKGKGKRSKRFRRRNKNWAYSHLAKRLDEIGMSEGFRLIKVNPAYSSQECPNCGFINRANRQGYRFKCLKCGFKGNTDNAAAVNLVGRVARDYSVPETRSEI